MGLGDVYLGAPVATPVDPRHRLVTTKYNPARTWTPPNVVGIGGAYMCIYGMEDPGGYQLFGRTIQVWNTWRQTDAFTEGKPWLLRFFDQIRFFPVSAEELTEWRRDFPLGRRSDPRSRSPNSAWPTIAPFSPRMPSRSRRSRRTAPGRLRRRARRMGAQWRVRPGHLTCRRDRRRRATAAIEVPEGAELVEAPFGGSVWKLLVAPGDTSKQAT
jgi:urea carboxylase